MTEYDVKTWLSFIQARAYARKSGFWRQKASCVIPVEAAVTSPPPFPGVRTYEKCAAYVGGISRRAMALVQSWGLTRAGKALLSSAGKVVLIGLGPALFQRRNRFR